MTDYSSEEFWKGAPEGATGYLPESGDWYAVWVKEAGNIFFTWLASGDTEWDEDDTFDEVVKCLVRRPITQPWSGDGLPPVGASVVLDDECFPVFDDYRAMIGVPVVVTAAFKSPTGVDMIACALPGGLCGCFRADMARPTKTPAQIAAEEREAGIQKMLLAVNPVGHLPGYMYQIVSCLYDAGLRFPKGDDQ